MDLELHARGRREHDLAARPSARPDTARAGMWHRRNRLLSGTSARRGRKADHNRLLARNGRGRPPPRPGTRPHERRGTRDGCRAHGPARRLRRRRAVPLRLHADARPRNGARGNQACAARRRKAFLRSGERPNATLGPRSRVRARAIRAHADAAAGRSGDLRDGKRGAHPGAGHGCRLRELESRRSRSSGDSTDSSDYWRFLEDLAGVSRWCSSGSATASGRRSDEAMEQNAESFRSNGGYAMPGVALNAVAS